MRSRTHWRRPATGGAGARRDTKIAVIAASMFFAFATWLSASSALAADGAALFAKNCASCHGADGQSDTPVGKAMKVPALAGKTLSAEDLSAVIKGNDKHKKLAGSIDDAQLAALADFVSALGAP